MKKNKFMKKIIIFCLLWLSFTSSAQPKNEILTVKYAGKYSFGTDIEKGRVGTIYIYPETDNTILFYIDLNRGAPSYNMGSLYGRVKITNNVGIFYTKLDDTNTGCKLSFTFTKDSLKIETFENGFECGFGYAVHADGTFKRKTTKIQNSFKNPEGIEIYFNKTKPEEYNKD
jgi:hypothetical protein